MLTLNHLVGFTAATASGDGLSPDPNAAALVFGLTGKGAHGTTPVVDLRAGGLTWAGNAAVTTAASYRYPSSLGFDGTGDWIIADARPGLAFGTGDFTISFAVNLSGISGRQILVSTYNGLGGYFYVDANNGVNGRIGIDINGTAYGTPTAVLSPGVWAHVEISRASGTLRIFVNGVSMLSAPATGNLAEDGPLYIGADGYTMTLPTTGNMQDVLIYKGACVHTSDFTPPAAGYADTYAID